MVMEKFFLLIILVFISNVSKSSDVISKKQVSSLNSQVFNLFIQKNDNVENYEISENYYNRPVRSIRNEDDDLINNDHLNDLDENEFPSSASFWKSSEPLGQEESNSKLISPKSYIFSLLKSFINDTSRKHPESVPRSQKNESSSQKLFSESEISSEDSINEELSTFDNVSEFHDNEKENEKKTTPIIIADRNEIEMTPPFVTEDMVYDENIEIFMSRDLHINESINFIEFNTTEILYPSLIPTNETRMKTSNLPLSFNFSNDCCDNYTVIEVLSNLTSLLQTINESYYSLAPETTTQPGTEATSVTIFNESVRPKPSQKKLFHVCSLPCIDSSSSSLDVCDTLMYCTENNITNCCGKIEMTVITELLEGFLEKDNSCHVCITDNYLLRTVNHSTHSYIGMHCCPADKIVPAEAKKVRKFSVVDYLKIVSYGLIFFVGLVGNVLVMVTLTKNKKLRTVTNIFLINLVSLHSYFL